MDGEDRPKDDHHQSCSCLSAHAELPRTGKLGNASLCCKAKSSVGSSVSRIGLVSKHGARYLPRMINVGRRSPAILSDRLLRDAISSSCRRSASRSANRRTLSFCKTLGHRWGPPKSMGIGHWNRHQPMATLARNPEGGTISPPSPICPNSSPWETQHPPPTVAVVVPIRDVSWGGG